jgi:hypothetical protein
MVVMPIPYHRRIATEAPSVARWNRFSNTASILSMTDAFYSIHRHQMVRVAAATPLATVGDVASNVAAAVAMAVEADARGVDLVVFLRD